MRSKLQLKERKLDGIGLLRNSTGHQESAEIHLLHFEGRISRLSSIDSQFSIKCEAKIRLSDVQELKNESEIK